MTAHRYWRIRGLHTNGDNMGAAEVQFRTAIGGATVATGGTAIASSYYSGSYQPAYAFDGNLSTYWFSTSSTPGAEWIGYDFGSGNAQTIVEATLTEHSGDPTRTPSHVAVEYSDDATTWTIAFIKFLGTFTDLEQKVFHANTYLGGGHRYWRMLETACNGDLAAAAEVGFFETVGGTNIARDAINLGSSAFGGSLEGATYGIHNAFDNNTASYWVAATNSANTEWVGADFGPGNAPTIIEASVTAHPGDPTRTPSDVAIQYSDDGVTWTSYFTAHLGTFTDGQTKTFDKPVVATPAIHAPQAGDLAVFRVSTVSIKAPAGGTMGVYNVPTASMRSTASGEDIVYRRQAQTLHVEQASQMAVVAGRVANPRIQSWTFTLDGHDFFVLRLGDTSTLIYDDYADEWVEWTYADLPFWTPRTGCNWIGAQGLAYTYGSDVVMGDDTYGLLWFLNPKGPFDDHPDYLNVTQQIPFTRIVTGQTLMNGRDFKQCFAIWLDGDNYGLTATDFVPQITLEYSDDQGRNFNSAGTLTVAPDYEQTNPYAWYSLGQISAPGRIFRITDNGVYERIDAMEMNDDG